MIEVQLLRNGNLWSPCKDSSVDKIREVLRLVQGMKKELMVAVMDRRGEIVYYTLGRLNL